MAKLFVVPTPIGNLEDFTFRAVRILEEVDLILAEDTRTSAKLMVHYQISTTMRSFHMHNEHKTIDKWIELFRSDNMSFSFVATINLSMGNPIFFAI